MLDCRLSLLILGSGPQMTNDDEPRPMSNASSLLRPIRE